MSTNQGDILRAAADDLELNGWCQGTLHEGSASCLMGAIYRASGVDDTHPFLTEREAITTRHAAIFVQGLVGPDTAVSSWNDMPWRTQAEVVKVLLTAADLADVQEES